MHRKSIEAADQLKDENTNSNASEKEDNEDEEGGEDDDDEDEEEENHEERRIDNEEVRRREDEENEKHEENEIKNFSRVSLSPHHAFHHQSEVAEAAHLRIQQEIQTQMEHHHAAVMQLAAANVNSTTDPEEFRNNSIACLRAKAQEHSAKILSLSADALMLENAAAILRSSNSMRGPHCDANANLTNHHGMLSSAEAITSSDNNSSLF